MAHNGGFYNGYKLPKPTYTGTLEDPTLKRRRTNTELRPYHEFGADRQGRAVYTGQYGPGVEWHAGVAKEQHSTVPGYYGMQQAPVMSYYGSNANTAVCAGPWAQAGNNVDNMQGGLAHNTQGANGGIRATGQTERKLKAAGDEGVVSTSVHKGQEPVRDEPGKESSSAEDESDEEGEEDNLEYGREPSTPAVEIAGTFISLNTAEEIEKWREDRRKMWLLRISNNRQKHMKDLGLDEKEAAKSPLAQLRKDKKFIQSIQSQISKTPTKSSLSLGLVQRTMKSENSKLLAFIKYLGDNKLLEYELSEKEKQKLFVKHPRPRGGEHFKNNKKQAGGRAPRPQDTHADP